MPKAHVLMPVQSKVQTVLVPCLFLSFMYVCGGGRGVMHLSTVLVEVRDDIRFPGAEVIGGCQLTIRRAGN